MQVQGEEVKFHSKWPTLSSRLGHALQRTVTNSTILFQPHFMTVLTNFEADPINSLGGVRSNTMRKSEIPFKMANFDITPRTRPSTYSAK